MSGSLDTTIIVWNVHTGNIIHKLIGKNNTIREVGFLLFPHCNLLSYFIRHFLFYRKFSKSSVNSDNDSVI